MAKFYGYHIRRPLWSSELGPTARLAFDQLSFDILESGYANSSNSWCPAPMLLVRQFSMLGFPIYRPTNLRPQLYPSLLAAQQVIGIGIEHLAQFLNLNWNRIASSLWGIASPFVLRLVIYSHIFCALIRANHFAN